MIEKEIPSDDLVADEEHQEFFEHHRIRVDAGQTAVRIDKYLSEKIAAVSRSKIQQAADEELIRVNGEPVKSNYRVRPQDEIVIILPHPKEQFDLQPENIPLSIIYEDDDVVVINKPAGLVVHPGHGNYTGTLVNGLIYHFKHLPAKPENEFRPGLVHRIDKDTSGLILVAKNDFALNFLGQQFFNHTIKRVYQALVWGTFDEREGTVEGNIGRHLKDRTRMQVFTEGDHGKNAITHFKVIENLGHVSLIECRLETGRTHQIRAHLSHIGHPIFNDETYGGDRIVKGTVYAKYKQFVDNCFKIMPRQALHAKSIGFIHPATKKEMFFDSELPDDFKAVLEKWRKFMQALKES